MLIYDFLSKIWVPSICNTTFYFRFYVAENEARDKNCLGRCLVVLSGQSQFSYTCLVATSYKVLCTCFLSVVNMVNDADFCM